MSLDISAKLLDDFRVKVANGSCDNLSPLLPGFVAEGNPMSLQDHYMFYPVFNLKTSTSTVLKCGRQVGKSYAISCRGVLLCGLIAGFSRLYIQPRFEQVKKFSKQIMTPLAENCLFRPFFFGTKNSINMQSIDFINTSRILLDYCFLDPGRIRGITGIHSCAIDEVDDIVYDFIPVIRETMAASKRWMFAEYSGTPKLTDGPLNTLWEDSSMGEWAAKCDACNHWNIGSANQDLLGMIGKETTVCAKCGKNLNCRKGEWVHTHPARRAKFTGWHISQVIHPRHYELPLKWADLLNKQRNYSKQRFFNEVLGEACDESVKLLTKADILRASGAHKNTSDAAADAYKFYDTRVLGVDWSGGGELTHSYTAIAMVGSRPGEDALTCLYAARLPQGMDPAEEARLIAHYLNLFRCSFLAHDYTGAGYLRESLLIQAGVPAAQIVPFTYVYAPTKSIVSHVPPTAGFARHSYRLDKARSLGVICEMIKCGKIILPDFAGAFDVTADLLALVENPKETERGGTIFLITSRPRQPDDFAHSLNFACFTIWHRNQRYPDMAAANKFKIPETALAMLEPK